MRESAAGGSPEITGSERSRIECRKSLRSFALPRAKSGPVSRLAPRYCCTQISMFGGQVALAIGEPRHCETSRRLIAAQDKSWRGESRPPTAHRRIRIARLVPAIEESERERERRPTRDTVFPRSATRAIIEFVRVPWSRRSPMKQTIASSRFQTARRGRCRCARNRPGMPHQASTWRCFAAYPRAVYLARAVAVGSAGGTAFHFVGAWGEPCVFAPPAADRS